MIHLPQYLKKDANGKRTSVISSQSFWLVAVVHTLSALLSVAMGPVGAVISIAAATVIHTYINVRLYQAAKTFSQEWVHKHREAPQNARNLLTIFQKSKVDPNVDRVSTQPLADALNQLSADERESIQAAHRFGLQEILAAA
jgi:hypothetical protein